MKALLVYGTSTKTRDLKWAIPLVPFMPSSHEDSVTVRAHNGGGKSQSGAAGSIGAPAAAIAIECFASSRNHLGGPLEDEECQTGRTGSASRHHCGRLPSMFMAERGIQEDIEEQQSSNKPMDLPHCLTSSLKNSATYVEAARSSHV